MKPGFHRDKLGSSTIVFAGGDQGGAGHDPRRSPCGPVLAHSCFNLSGFTHMRSSMGQGGTNPLTLRSLVSLVAQLLSQTADFFVPAVRSDHKSAHLSRTGIAA